jgi:hypothetical protein
MYFAASTGDQRQIGQNARFVRGMCLAPDEPERHAAKKRSIVGVHENAAVDSAYACLSPMQP